MAKHRGFLAGSIAPLPLDAPVLAWPHDVAPYLRSTSCALQKLLDCGDTPLANFLRDNLVELSAKKRVILRDALLDWLRKTATKGAVSA